MANFNILWNLNSVVDSQHSIPGVQEWIEVNSGKIPSSYIKVSDLVA